jgi:hypothetical protein
MTLRQAEKERAYKEKQKTDKQISEHHQQQQYKIVDFIGKFIESYERTPQHYEITGALKYDIEADILDEYLKTYDHKTYKRVNILNIV